MTVGTGAPIEGMFASASFALAVVPIVFVGLFIGFTTLMIVLLVKAARRERERRERLWAYAAQCGWRPIPVGMPLPGPVIEAARSGRSKLVLGTRFQEFDLWLVWHRWTERTGSGDTTSQTTRDLTRYFLWPGRPYPDVRVGRRTRIGASLMPVRGVGTGDAEFDKKFVVHSSMGAEMLGLLTPGLREAMVAGSLPVWKISGGALITAYNDAPGVENLQHRAGVIVQIARMLG